MVGKQIKGKGFRGCLDYVLGKKGAYIIGGTMCGQTAEALSTEFAITRQLKPHLKMAVFHATLSVDSREKLDSDVENERRWCSVANDYMKAMEFDNNQYVVVKHTDTQHDHIHIVGSRIRFDGTVVDDSWDYYKSQDVIRALEAKYNLEVLAPSWESEKRAQTTGEYRKNRDTGQKSVRVQLQALIEQCTHDNPTMPELIERLQQEDVEVQIRMTRTGCIKGISYQLNGIAFNGTQLGKTYTFHGLQKYRGISYDSEDNELLKMLTQQQVQAIITDSTEGLTDKSLPESNTHTDVSTDVIIGIALDALIAAESEQISLGQYQISWHQPQLTLSITDVDRGEIIKATFDANGNYQLHAAQITELDVEKFSAFDKQQKLQTQLEIE
ncbi:relaxase/mobilization nuclease domain-containing protein [Phormidium sp. LEGE 05292]|uniref:relaxase/mobilization nuclease domain-containing protein n=1 Tax=[Phormidium] sp. LEGE 05292 TaxID=767427 RepID=UPI0018815C59|nr:relaxase/mobilization nuclease domain-containing protein [Phormidium sp. LEGE 05292]MBE9228501.1 relaxase/mobilization nuclease domain-containing protein [Phormidium sp. LEGE 05292]